MPVDAVYPDDLPTDAEWEDTLVGFGAGDGNGNLIDRQSYFASDWHNKIKKELQATTVELGLLPKGDHATVRARLDWMDTVFQPLEESAQPDISTGQHWIVSAVTPFTIDNFENPRVSGHMLVLAHFDGNVTIKDNNNIHLAGGVDKTPASGQVTVLYHDTYDWKEIVAEASTLRDVDGMIFAPDGLNDEVPMFHVDAAIYPNGINLVNVQITVPVTGAYTMVFEEWGGDPPAAVNDIATVTTASDSAYAEVITGAMDDYQVAADNYIFLDIPATDVDWVHVKVVYSIA